MKMEQKEEKKELKKLRADGNINNLTYQYYNTAMELANVKRMKDNVLKAQKQDLLSDDLDVTQQINQRRIRLSRKSYDVSGNSTSLKKWAPSQSTTQKKLMPAVVLERTDNALSNDETEYIQLPISLLSKQLDQNHKVVKEETHLLTPGKTPKIKIVSSKNSIKNKISKTTNKKALKERDLNTMKKNINMRDILSVKTRYDVSPVNKGDFLADVKLISKANQK